jgi:hypothetical protein
MNSFCLGLLRFVLCAWLGAATLFVVTGVREVNSEISPAIKNHLAIVRFPAFYLFGFVLTGLAGICSVVVAASKEHPKGKLIAALCLLALGIMIADYIWVYAPLADLMSQPNARETDAFRTYHAWSKYVNFGILGILLVAAIQSLRSK